MNFAFSAILCTFDCIKSKLSKNKKYINSRCLADLPKGFTVTYHAGAMHTKPNSLDSVKKAVECGAEILEFDVSFRPDGTAVIIHDSEPSQSQGILLKDALEVAAKSNSCRINLDIKSTKNLAEVDRLINLAGLNGRAFYTGVFADWVEAVKSNSSIPYYLNHKITPQESADPAEAQAVADKAKLLGAMGINAHFGTASKMFVEKMHENGLLISLWTVDKIPDMVKVIDLAPDNTTTKKPHIMNMILK